MLIALLTKSTMDRYLEHTMQVFLYMCACVSNMTISREINGNSLDIPNLEQCGSCNAEKRSSPSRHKTRSYQTANE